MSSKPGGISLFQDRPDGVHWKTGPLVDHANGRPFAWMDDEQSDLDQAYVTAHHHGPGLLHHVNARIGLREDDFRTLADFARIGPRSHSGIDMRRRTVEAAGGAGGRDECRIRRPF
jgi:hypothetical protein